MCAGIGLDVAGICKDQKTPGDPLGTLQQCQGVREDIVPVFRGIERKAHRHSQRGRKPKLFTWVNRSRKAGSRVIASMAATTIDSVLV